MVLKHTNLKEIYIMTKAKQNPMANLVQTVKQTSQGATVKTTSATPSLTPVEVLDLIATSATSCATGEKAKLEGESALKTFNDSAIKLHNGGVRLLDGRKKDPSSMAHRKAFLDQAQKDGLKEKTAQNYYEFFYKVVNTGKALASFHFKNDSAKKSKGEKSDTVEIFANTLVSAYNHPDFESALSVDAQNQIVEILKKAKCI